MSTGTSKTRTQRLASIASVPTRLHLAMTRLRQKSSIFCCLIFLTAFTVLVLLLGIWNPPFPYYEGMAINRDIVARVAFETIDSAETEKERILAANRVPYVYVRNENAQILDENISKIYRILKEASQADTFDKLSPELQQQFMVPEDSEDSGVETGTRNIWRFLRKNPVQDIPNSSDAGQKKSSVSSPILPVSPQVTLSGTVSENLSGMDQKTKKGAVSLDFSSEFGSAAEGSSLSLVSPSSEGGGNSSVNGGAARSDLPVPELPQDVFPVAGRNLAEKTSDSEDSRNLSGKPSEPEPRSVSVSADALRNPRSFDESPAGEAAENAEGALNEKTFVSAENSSGVERFATNTGEGVHESGTDPLVSSGKEAGESISPSVSAGNSAAEPPKELEKVLVSERSKEKEEDTEDTSDASKSKGKTKVSGKKGSKKISGTENHPKQDSVPAVKPEEKSENKNALEILAEKMPVLVQASPDKYSENSLKVWHSGKPAISSDDSRTASTLPLASDSSADGQEAISSTESKVTKKADSSENANHAEASSDFGKNAGVEKTRSADSKTGHETNLSANSEISSNKNENITENSSAMLEKSLTDFCDVLKETIRPFFLKGLMHIAEVKEDPLGRGLQVQIAILNPQNPETAEERVPLKSVILEDNSSLRDAIRLVAGNEDIGDQIYYCICRNWKSNLVLDPTLTNQAIQNARQSVEPVQKQYQISQRIVQMPVENDALVGTYLTSDMLKLLSIENSQWLESRTWEQKLTRGIAVGLILLLCLIPLWTYIAMEEPRIFQEFHRLIFILGFSILTLAAAVWCSRIPGLPHSMNLFPLILFGQILTIQYQRRIGILFGGMLLLCLYVTLGLTQMEMICDFGILLTAILPLDRVRGRMQFVRISLLASVFAFILFSAADLLMGIPLHLEIFSKVLLSCLPFLFAGLVIQSLLPLLERWLGILSDVRLLELCDVSNPLLNELVNRAPSTYSHSIALGTIGENAADAIHANGLLVRTAAYYHDIGKIFKPGYYAENIIEKEASPHLALEPTMSALIIIAHVKNGVALAQQYHLPQQIIDLIEQHHGSSLVAYFFNQAKNRRVLDPSIPNVEESSFRYPCSKPQTKEAVVLMLADACESACRSLVEPTPARIQGLVRKLAQERLEDEQFDESGITLRELRIVEDSIIKGLISYHHGRIKYPERIREEKTAKKPVLETGA
ncbi:MAG: HDIG domain-containing protein [Thermoguttaceae bacterium]|nr:HDIG domain-containing protein [Thermoguttaceae bacterium]